MKNRWKFFKEGIELSKFCAGRLDTARQTVEQIMETSSGYTTKPFEEIDE